MRLFLRDTLIAIGFIGVPAISVTGGVQTNVSLLSPQLELEETALPEEYALEEEYEGNSIIEDVSALSDIIIAEGDIPQARITGVLNQFNRIPEGIRNDFILRGGQIHIANDVGPMFGFGKCTGVTKVVQSTGEVNIWIDNRDKAVKSAVIHEMGHALDFMCAFPSQTEEFTAIYNEECGNFCDCDATGDKHEISDTREYFASVFSNIIKNGAQTQATVPRSYEYVNRYIY